MDEPHLCVVQPELVGPLIIHPVEAVELLDRTLVQDGLRFGVLEELVDGLGDQPDREVVVAVVPEHRLEERQTRGVLHDVARLVDVEHDLLLRDLRPLVHQRDQQLHRQCRAAVDAALLLSEVEVDDLLVPNVEVGLLAEVAVPTVVLEGAELIEQPRRVLFDLPCLFVGPNDELLRVVDHILEDVHHLADGRTRIVVRRDVVGDALALVRPLEPEFERCPAVAQRDAAEREEVREEAHRVVELLVERTRVLAHRALDVFGRLADLQGVQAERPTDGDSLGVECL